MTQNNDDIFNLRNLAVERDEARENLKGNISETKERVKPSNLVKSVKTKAVQRAQQTGETAIQGVKSNPGIVASVAAAATLFAFRKPLTRFVVKRRNSAKDPANENLKD